MRHLLHVGGTKRGTGPSLASCCDLPSWTPLPLLALESLLPLTVLCSGFTRLASVSCMGVSSSGFRCVETNRGAEGREGRQKLNSGTKLDGKKIKNKKISMTESCKPTFANTEAAQWRPSQHNVAHPGARSSKPTTSQQQTHTSSRVFPTDTEPHR